MINDTSNALRPNAWLLNFGVGLRAAVGTRVLMHLIENPTLHLVPCTPAYCQHVVVWQDRLLPVIDMSVRLADTPQSPQLLVITAHQDPAANLTCFGALLLSATPLAIAIPDTPAAELPDYPGGWRDVALSCGNYQEEPLPILNLTRVFSPSDVSSIALDYPHETASSVQPQLFINRQY